MKAFFLFFFVISNFSLVLEAAEPIDCMSVPDFRYDAGALTTFALAKEGCTLKVIASGAKSERFEISLCQKDTQFKQFIKLDDHEPKIIKPHSKDCPRPLIDGHKNSAAEFASAKKRIFEIFMKVQEVYGLANQETLAKVANLSTASSELKMACLKALLTEYLDKCLALPEVRSPAQNTEPLDSKSLPPGIHPETIKLND